MANNVRPANCELCRRCPAGCPWLWHLSPGRRRPFPKPSPGQSLQQSQNPLSTGWRINHNPPYTHTPFTWENHDDMSMMLVMMLMMLMITMEHQRHFESNHQPVMFQTQDQLCWRWWADPPKEPHGALACSVDSLVVVWREAWGGTRAFIWCEIVPWNFGVSCDLCSLQLYYFFSDSLACQIPSHRKFACQDMGCTISLDVYLNAAANPDDSTVLWDDGKGSKHCK